jgi:signal transduction histidine kinase
MSTDLPIQPPNTLLESIFQNPLNGVLLCTAVRDDNNGIVDFRFVRCNGRAVDLIGFTKEHLLATSMLTLDPGSECSGIFDLYKQVVETGLPTHIEYYLANTNRWVAQSLARYEDSLLVSWTDISDQKQAELTRANETELLQAILDNTQTGITVMESVRDSAGRIVDFRITHVNANAERMIRRSKEALIGELYTETWPDARLNGTLSWYLQVAETGEPIRINGVNLPAEGYDGWYNIRARPLLDGVIVTFVDVTALKRAELANQQQAELLRSVLDGSSNAIIAFRAIRDEQTGKIIDFQYAAQNEANRQILGRSDEETIGHSMLDYFPYVIQTGLFDRYVEVVETGEPTRFEQEYNYDSLIGWYELSVLKWEDGIVLTTADITARKTYEQQLEQTNRELKNANEHLKQFAYIASHDLQEPLRKLTAFGDILQAQFDTQLGDYGNDIIKRMQSAVSRMSTLIKDVLTYSKVGTQREAFQPINLAILIKEIKVEIEAELESVGGVLCIDTMPLVKGDPAQLRQLFTNLILNALKFRSAERPVDIHITYQLVSGSEKPADLIPRQTYHKIGVADNGIGFEEKYAEQIFQVFQRLNNRQKYEGTGVGLAICRRVVENHRGIILAKGQLGEGATFDVYLPV